MRIDYSTPFEGYLAAEAISKHGLDLIAKSPAHFRWQQDHPEERTPSEAMKLGTLVHAFVLEPSTVADTYAVSPKFDRRTKAGKAEAQAFAAENEGKEIVSEDVYATASAMAGNVLAHPTARILLRTGQPEVSLFFDLDGVQCKARPDWLGEDHNVILDLKTAVDGSPGEFARACGKFRYFVQDAWYTMAAKACGLGDRDFIFLVVENQPPYEVSLYTLDYEAKSVGHQLAMRDLATYSQCVESGEWPGYSDDILPLQLPKWSLK